MDDRQRAWATVAGLAGILWVGTAVDFLTFWNARSLILTVQVPIEAIATVLMLLLPRSAGANSSLS